MIDDIVPLVLNVIANEKSTIELDEIIEESSCEKVEVLKALNLLQNLKLVNKDTEAGQTVYSLVKELKAIDLARAAQVGLDLSEFEKHFKVNNKEKKLALEISTKAEKIKSLDVNKRKPLIQKRSYLSVSKTDDVYENLLLLLEVTNDSLYEYLEQLSADDNYLKLLLSMHEQSETSLRTYSNDLLK